MSYILIEKKDIKSYKIAESFIRRGIEVKYLPNNPIYNIVFYLYFLLKLGKPQAIIYRYMNDFDKTYKNVFKLISDYFEYSISRLLKIKILWICHNLDRETHIFSPLINNMRRKLRSRNCSNIFVTDPLLIPHVNNYLKIDDEKISNITFGEMEDNNCVYVDQHFIQSKVENFIYTEKQKSKQKVYFTLCAGKPNHKTLHYEKLKKLLDSASAQNIELRAIVIGPLNEYYSKANNEVLDFIKLDKRVLFIEGFYNFSENEFSEELDFFWRVYKDYSVPGTIYKATFLNKPIITMEYGILHEIVKKNSIGFVIDENFLNIKEVIGNLDKIKLSNFSAFNQTHNWVITSNKIFEKF